MKPTDLLARQILDVVPLVMRAIRKEMRSHRASDLSIVQFRSLAHISHFPGSSLSDLADHLGLTPPSTSSLVDGLVERGLVSRRERETDRRRVSLSLTESGQALFDQARSGAQQRFSELFAGLSPEECAQLTAALNSLEKIFTT